MAPSPEHDNEPKAPDKNENKSSEGVELRTNEDFLTDHLSSSSRDLDLQDSSVSTLDDSQLKALLDEAITYKTPKDREGKSRMFKALLQAAEEDERNARAASASGPQLARYYSTATAAAAAAARRTRTRHSAAAARTHGGSLQDLAQPDLYDSTGVPGSHGGGRKSSRRRQTAATGHRTVSVSARQREGGSLPSNVNAGALYVDPTATSDSPIAKRSDDVPMEGCTVATATTTVAAVTTAEYTLVNVESTTTDSLLTPLHSPSTNSNVTPVSSTVDATSEETRGLLQRDARVTYSSTDTLRFQYGTATEPDDKDEQPVATVTARKSTTVFDGVTRHQYFNPLDEALQHRIPRIKYTSRATLEVDGMSTVDKAITFSQFQHDGNSTSGATSLQLDPEYSSVRCIVDGGGDSASGTGNVTATRTGTQTTAIVSTPYRLLSVANPKIIHGVERFQHSNEKKGLDENGNAVSTTTTPADAKKKKKCKVDRNVTVLKSENLPGHRADIIESIDLLVKYIEEDDVSSSKSKHHHNHHHKPSLNHKLPMEKKRARMKTKHEANTTNTPVVKKSNSLEEISKTKLEDLMSEDSKNLRRVKKQSTSEDGDRRSWGIEDSTNFLDSDLIAVGNTVMNSETEFHVVTKKKKSKKRSKTQNQQPVYCQYHYQRISAPIAPPAPAVQEPDRTEPQRRKSACSVPPSDKSADSSDVDSVHSLPVATVHRCEETGAQSAAQASTSYADIARTNGGQSASSASSNCSSHSGSYTQTTSQSHQWNKPLVLQQQPQPQPQPVSVASISLPARAEPSEPEPQPPRLDTTDFPCLAPANDLRPKDLKSNESVVRSVRVRRGTSRPAVIILDDEQNGETPPSGPIQVSGLTFGFELNEQLLNDSEGESTCDTPPLGPTIPRLAPIDVFTARYMPPRLIGGHTDSYNHDKIVNFVGLAWEDVVHQSDGKVQYYNGQ